MVVGFCEDFWGDGEVEVQFAFASKDLGGSRDAKKALSARDCNLMNVHSNF